MRAATFLPEGLKGEEEQFAEQTNADAFLDRRKSSRIYMADQVVFS
jgi:hypothetical protein